MKAVRQVKIAGMGSCVPQKVLTNQDLTKMVDTSDEWIVEMTGIKTRYIVEDDQSTSDLAVGAALECLSNAAVAPEDVDLIIVASATPDHLFPATSCLVQHAIGAKRAAAFDMEIGCTGFISAVVTGSQFVASGTYDNVLVIGAETLSRIVDWTDRGTCCLFGDGAGACLLVPGAPGEGIVASELGSDGSQSEVLKLPAGAAKHPATEETVRDRMHYIKMEGRPVFRFAVKIMAESILRLLASCGKSIEDIDLLVPHQANIRIIDSALTRFSVPRDKVVINIDKYGNTSSASVAIALHEAVREGRVRKGDLVVLVAFGAGLSWGSLAIIW